MGKAVWLLKHVGRHVQIVEARHGVELLERGELVGIQIEHFEVRHVLEFFNVRNFILAQIDLLQTSHVAQTLTIDKLVLGKIKYHYSGVAVEVSSRCNCILCQVDLRQLRLSQTGQLSNLVDRQVKPLEVLERLWACGHKVERIDSAGRR